MNLKIRKYGKTDYKDLVELWSRVFGDGEDFVVNFLDNIADGETSRVAEIDGVVVAAAYVVAGISVLGEDYPYIYAVSTLPEFRGRGLGRALSVACARSAPNSALHPAETSLFDWYADMGFVPVCKVREAKLAIDSDIEFEVSKVSADEYFTAREAMLKDTRSAQFSKNLLEWQSGFGVEYYTFDGGCMSGYCDGDCAIVQELLAKANAKLALSALGTIYNVKDIQVRTPALPEFEGFGDAIEFVSAFGTDAKLDYWGFAID